MINGRNERLYCLASRLLHDVSDALKEKGLSEVECWVIMFDVAQDLQANALGIGSESHLLTMEWQRESLDKIPVQSLYH